METNTKGFLMPIICLFQNQYAKERVPTISLIYPIKTKRYRAKDTDTENNKSQFKLWFLLLPSCKKTTWSLSEP